MKTKCLGKLLVVILGFSMAVEPVAAEMTMQSLTRSTKIQSLSMCQNEALATMPFWVRVLDKVHLHSRTFLWTGYVLGMAPLFGFQSDFANIGLHQQRIGDMVWWSAAGFGAVIGFMWGLIKTPPPTRSRFVNSILHAVYSVPAMLFTTLISTIILAIISSFFDWPYWPPLNSPEGLMMDKFMTGVTVGLAALIAAVVAFGILHMRGSNTDGQADQDSSRFHSDDHYPDQFRSPAPLFVLSAASGLTAWAVSHASSLHAFANVPVILSIAAGVLVVWGLGEILTLAIRKATYRSAENTQRVLGNNLATVLRQDPTLSDLWDPMQFSVRLATPQDRLPSIAYAVRQGNVIIVHPAFAGNPRVLRHELTHLLIDGDLRSASLSETLGYWLLWLPREIRARTNEFSSLEHVAASA